MSEDEHILRYGKAYSTLFIHYDDEGFCHLISNTKSSVYKNFEIDLFLVEEYITGKKSCAAHNIEYFFNLSKGIILNESEAVPYSRILFQVIPIINQTVDSDVTICHHINEKEWIVSVDEKIKEKLDIIPGLTFYVCKKNDPHFLYRQFTITSDQLKNESVKVKFTSDIEENLDVISIASIKRFSKYGVKEKL